jgi:hypothetical protein
MSVHRPPRCRSPSHRPYISTPATLLLLQVYVNESVDPTIIIARLKQEVRDLKAEVALLKGGAPQRGPLTPDELLRLRQQLLAFVDDPPAGGGASDGGTAASAGGGGSSGSSSGLNFGGDMMMIRASECA